VRIAMLAGLLTVGVGVAQKPGLLRRLLFAEAAATSNKSPTLKVWVNRRSGFYYCPHSTLYGRLEPGVYMVQAEAVQSGFRPAPQLPCN
jgi:hypothetical protein